MTGIDNDTSWMNNNKDTSNISINIKKHIKHGRHRAKYNFSHDPNDVVDRNIQEYTGIDNVKYLHTYMKDMNLGEVEFSVFQCKSKGNIPAYYANIKLDNVSLASSFPEKYSLPEVAKQVAARNALAVLKKNHSLTNKPVTQDMNVVAKRLENELKKNFAGLFCDKVEDIYKEVYNESLPSDWLVRLHSLSTHIIIEDLPIQNKSILYYASIADKKKHEELLDSSLAEISDGLPLMKFVDKTERSVCVTNVDSNHTFWILFVHDRINDDYNSLFQLMNMPDETEHFVKMFSIELFDLYAVKIGDIWYRYQVIKIEDDFVTGIFIDLGMEWCVAKNNVMFLPQKFLNVPSQAIKCALTDLFFAPYFPVTNELFHLMLYNKEFTVVPDNIDNEVPLVTLYSGKFNVNSMIMDAILEKTEFKKIDITCEGARLSFIGDGYVYLHPPNETLVILESILDTIPASHPPEQLYSTKSISPHKVYLVKCTELQLWSRAVINDFIFVDQKFKVFFIDYGNCGLIDQDKFIDLHAIDPLLAKISPQALKVSFHLFPPKKLSEKHSKALYEMMSDKSLDVKVISTDNDGLQIVEIYESNENTTTPHTSYNTQLYQSV